MLSIVDDQAAETGDLGGLARQQEGGRVELRQDRWAGDSVAGAEVDVIVDQGVGPAGSQRDGLMPDDRGGRIAAGRQYRQLPSRKMPNASTRGVTISTGRVESRKGVEATR